MSWEQRNITKLCTRLLYDVRKYSIKYLSKRNTRRVLGDPEFTCDFLTHIPMVWVCVRWKFFFVIFYNWVFWIEIRLKMLISLFFLFIYSLAFIHTLTTQPWGKNIAHSHEGTKNHRTCVQVCVCEDKCEGVCVKACVEVFVWFVDHTHLPSYTCSLPSPGARILLTHTKVQKIIVHVCRCVCEDKCEGVC